MSVSICKILLENPKIKEKIDLLLAHPAIELQFFVCSKNSDFYTSPLEMGSPESIASYFEAPCEEPIASIHSHTGGEPFSVQDIVIAVEGNCQYICLVDVQSRKLTCINTASPKVYEIVDEYTETFGSTFKPIFYGTQKQALRAYNRLQKKVQKLPVECTAPI